MKKFLLFTSISILIGIINSSIAQTTGDYRSKATSDWSLTTTWQRFNGTNWVDATATPSSSDGAITIISGHEVTISTNQTIDQVTIASGGTLTISFGTCTINNGTGTDLTCNGTLNFSNGTLFSSGTEKIQSGSTFNWTGGTVGGSGTMTINAGAAFNMSFGYHFLADTKTINNSGTWTWTSGPLFFSATAPVINNLGTFNISTDDDVFNNGTTTGTFVNKSSGVINKIGSPNNETSFSGFSSFTNEGTININSSNINFSVNSTHSGSITVALGAAVRFPFATATFNAGSTFSGAGSTTFDGGTTILSSSITSATSSINISSGSVTGSWAITVGSGSTLNLSGGTFSNSADLTMSNGSTFNWSGGVLGGSGIVTINSGAVFNMNINHHYMTDTKRIDNYGTWTWTAGDLIYQATAPAVNNYGTFNISTDNRITNDGTTSGTFFNHSGAIINKIGSPNLETQFIGFSSFTNEGTININSGKLNFYINSIQSGSINVPLGSEARFSFGTTNFNSSSSIIWAGTLTFVGGTITVNAALTVSAGTTLNLFGGILNTNTDITMASGSTFNWTDGTLGGSGTLTINSGATFNLSNYFFSGHTLADTKTINNYGTWNWTGGAIDYKPTAPALNNYATLNLNNDYDVSSSGGANTGSFFNHAGAVINKTGTPGSETVFSGVNSFTNEGTININSGIINFKIINNHSGAISVASGTEVRFSSGTANFNTGTTFSGTGSTTFNGGTIIINSSLTTATSIINISSSSTVSGPWTIPMNSGSTLNLSGGTLNSSADLTMQSGSTLNLSGGALNNTADFTMQSGSTFNWTGGTNGGSGTTTISAGVNFTMSGSTHYIKDTRALNNYTTWNWTGGDLYFNTTQTISNFGIFNINTDADITNNTTHNATFINKSTGIINKTGTDTLFGTQVSNLSSFSNEGAINVNSGILNLNLSGTHSGSYNVSVGAELTGFGMFFTGSTFTNNGTVTLTSASPLYTGLSFSGTSAQSLNGTGSIVGLTINNTIGVTLGGTQTIIVNGNQGNLNLKAGKINIGNNDLIMEATTLLGGSSSSYIVTDGTGSLRRKVINNNTNVLFPVGQFNSYLPVNIKLTFGSTTDTFYVRVLPNIYGAYDATNTPVGTVISAGTVNATWIISEVVSGGSTATVTPQWNATDEAPGFSRSSSRFGQYTAGAWNLGTATAASGSNPYSLSPSDITSFSPFGIINQFVTCNSPYTPLCTGNSVSVPYIAVGTFNAGNLFKAQLSDALGSFSSPVNIGSVSATSSGNISATIPGGTASGSGYKIRVTSNNPAFTSGDNGSAIEIGITKKYFQDSDGDAYGNQSVSQLSCSGVPTGYVLDSTDCNDSNIAIHPNATEICNALDDDCDIQTDEGLKTTYYKDADSDGYGNPAIHVVSCSQPSHFVTDGTDCNDANADIHPDVTDECNGVDDNCDNATDEAIWDYHFTDDIFGIPNSVSVNVTATNLNRVNGAALPLFSCTTGFSVRNFTSATSFNASLPAIEFTITPVDGYELEATSFSADLRRSAAGPSSVRFAYSINGGTTWKNNGSNYSVNSSSCGMVTTYNWNFSDFTTDQPVKFRVYGFNASKVSGILQMLNVNLMGTVCSSGLIRNSDQPGVQKEESETSFSIYPNPTAGKFIVELTTDEPENEIATIEVMNEIGQIVSSRKEFIINGKLKEQISMDHSVAEGVYMVRLIVHNQIYSERILYQK